IVGDLGDLRRSVVRPVADDADLRRLDDRAAADRHQCLAGYAGGQRRLYRAGPGPALLACQDAVEDLRALDPALFFFRGAARLRLRVAGEPGGRDPRRVE